MCILYFFQCILNEFIIFLDENSMASAKDWFTKLYSASTESESEAQQINGEAIKEANKIFQTLDLGKDPRIQIYSPIPVTHEVISTSILFGIGLVFNLIILLCYWRDKSRTAVYIRGCSPSTIFAWSPGFYQ